MCAIFCRKTKKEKERERRVKNHRNEYWRDFVIRLATWRNCSCFQRSFCWPRQIQLPFFSSSLFCARVLSATSCRIVFIVWRTGKRREGRPVLQREIYLIVHLTNVVTPSLIFY